MKQKQQGYVLVATLLALVLAGLAAAVRLNADLIETRRSAGNAEAGILQTIQQASNRLLDEAAPTFRAGTSFAKNGTTLTMALVAGSPTYAVTVPNLVSMGYLPTGWNAVRSTLNEQTYTVRVTRTPVGCLPAACNLEGLVWINGAILRDNTVGTTDGIAIGAMLVKIGADAGTTVQGASATITGFGNGWSTPNPVAGQPAGVFALRFGGANTVDFLRVGETRDPTFGSTVTVAGPTALGGTLTVAGPTTISNNLNVTGTLTTGVINSACVNINGTTGRAGFGCANPLDVPAGYLGVRSPDLVAQNRVLVSSAPGAFTGANGNYVLITSANGSGVALVATSGAVEANRLVPTGLFTEGAACTEDAALARRTGGGSLLCAGGVWTRLLVSAAAGAACAPDGSSASTSAGAALFCIGGRYAPLSGLFPVAVVGAACTQEGVVGYSFNVSGAPTQSMVCRRNNANLAVSPVWYRIQDITSNFAFVQALEVTDGTVVAKPSCPVAGGQSVFPVLQLIPKTEASSDSGFSRFAIDNGASWTVQLKNGAGGPLTSSSGGAVAVGQTFCFYV